MAIIDDIADELALRALALEEKTGDETLIKLVGDGLASSSPTMEERFLTAVRIRRGQRRAVSMLDAFEAGIVPDKPGPPSDEPLALPPTDDDVTIDVD